METKESTDDLELGEITIDSNKGNENDTGIESLSLPPKTLVDSIGQNMTGTSEDGAELDTSSHSGMWSTSNDTAVTPSTTNQGSQLSNSGMSEESLSIAKRENLAVMTWRLVMFGVLIVTTIAAAVVVHTVVHEDQKVDFETAFIGDSEKIYKSVADSIDTKLEAVDSLALLLVSSGRERNEVWPFTSLPDFAAKAAKIRMMSNAIAIQQYQIVEEDQRSKWEAWAKANEAWVQETIDIQREDTTLPFDVKEIPDYDINQNTFIRYSGPSPNNTRGYTPTWHAYPMIPQETFSAYNFNTIQSPILGPGVKKVIEDHRAVLGPILNYEDEELSRINQWARRHISPNDNAKEPIIRMLYPILNTSKGAVTIDEPDSKVIGIIASSFFMRKFLENILPDGERGLVVVFQNTCNQTFTYEVNGHEAKWLGDGDLHDSQFDHLGFTKDLDEMRNYSKTKSTYGGLPINIDFCHYTVSTYPSITMKNSHLTNSPTYYSLIAVSIFIFTAMIFLCYDKLVSVRQQKVMKTAVQSTTIVSSLFPSNVRDRLLDVSGDGNHADPMRGTMFQPTKSLLRTFLNDGEPSTSNKPIADLFTATTVMFADIAGFTAWSSVREPTQVFTLLETVYGAFDILAARRGVFKVETIGDSYVAVTGLPDPRKDHAVAMAKFARDCRGQFNELCSALESTLGPETGDLNLRIGLNSGPVTAGVLRGQKSRFQLFGDTVNTAARMESTGEVNKIQVSQATADLLKKGRKSHWLQAREEMVEAKGKGLMVTYWVEPKSVASSTVSSTADLTTENTTENTKGNLSLQDDTAIRVSSPMERLVNWNIDVLERLLKKIVANRIALKRKSNIVNWNRPIGESLIVLNEVQEVIKLPEYDSKYHDLSPDSIVLEPLVRFQLREFVTAIALTYHNNPFHNFPHASHVGMSVAKLLSRIVAPDIDLTGYEQLHDHTYGITSDPLTQFACVFSALIHDADHPGVPNSQLVNEGTEMSETYEGKSIAEQNSVNIAWSILLQDKYMDLRNAICITQGQAIRFRQLVVNAVCATDIIDKDLKAARNTRWEKAFSMTGSSRQEQINRKATIVIEHIIQASDVAHTMQHWHIYIKWNERLYAEMYKAYTEGRSDRDPTSTWYKGEIGFFDFYIIPLAQKLSECGVFGVSSDEYLNYAIMNRNEWEKKGQDVVASYAKKYNRIDVDKPDENPSTTDNTTVLVHVDQP